MYESPARNSEGERIEEVLPAAITATATSEQRASRAGRELARRQSTDEPRMALMQAGSPVGQFGSLPAPLVVGAAVLLVALVILAIVLI